MPRALIAAALLSLVLPSLAWAQSASGYAPAYPAPTYPAPAYAPPAPVDTPAVPANAPRSAASAVAPPFAAASLEQPFSVAVWAQPAGLLFSVAATPGTYIPIGATFPINQQLAVVIELSGLFDKQSCTSTTSGCRTSMAGALASAGAQFAISGSANASGFFISTKLEAALANELGAAATDPVTGASFIPGTSAAVGAGVDVGYQFRYGAFYAAMLIGVTGSYDPRGLTASPLSLLIDPALAQAASKFVFAPNLNLLRVGAAF